MSYRHYFILKVILIVMFVLGCALSAYYAGWVYAESNCGEYCPIVEVDVHTDSSLKVRKGPGGADTYILLADGHELVILSQYKGWALANHPDLVGKRDPLGWVHTDYLKYTGKRMWVSWAINNATK